VGIQGPLGIRGPTGRQGPAGEKGSVVAGLGLHSVDVHSNVFVQHRTTNLRRPVIILEQPVFVFQRIVVVAS